MRNYILETATDAAKTHKAEVTQRDARTLLITKDTRAMSIIYKGTDFIHIAALTKNGLSVRIARSGTDMARYINGYFGERQ